MIIYSHWDVLRKPPTKRAIKECIKRFEETGQSGHSHYGLLMVYLLNYCEHRNIRYELTAWPDVGYTVRRIERNPEPQAE